MKKKIIALLLTLTAILLVFTACGKEEPNTDTNNSEAFFAAFESETLDGEKVSDEIFKGNKVTMVNVWGTFCGPCINEMPSLGKISKDYKDKGVCVIGVICDTYDIYNDVNIPEKVQSAKDIVAETGASYTHILPSASLNKAKLDTIFSVPTTYFLDENGAIIGSEYVGARSYEQWSAIIDSMLGE